MSMQDIRRAIPLIMAVLMIATAFIPAVNAAATTKIVSPADSRDTSGGTGLPPVPPGFSVPLRQDNVNATGTGYIPSKTRTIVQNESKYHLLPDEQVTGIHCVITDTGKIKEYNPAEKTITIKGSGKQAGGGVETEIEIRLVNATPDLGTFTEIFEITVPHDTVLDASEDFLATWMVCAGNEEVTGAEWFVWEDRIHTVEIPIIEYRDVIIEEGAISACDDIMHIPDGEVAPVMEIRNVTTGESESPIFDSNVTPKTIETSGFADQDVAAYENAVFREPYIAGTEIREESWLEWVPFDPTGQTLHAGETKFYKIVYTKPAEPGRVEIKTAPVFRGVECPEMTWWSTTWAYRVPVTVTNPPSIDGYPHREVVSFHTGMQSDFDDVRFVADDGTVLGYWKETYTASDSAVIWVNLPAGATSIWMYYGNAAATDIGSRNNAYILCDDFNGPSLDTTLWTDTTPGAHYFSNGWIYDTQSRGAGVLVSNDYVITNGEPVIVEMSMHVNNLPGSRTFCGYFPLFVDTPANGLLWYPLNDRYIVEDGEMSWRSGTQRGLFLGLDYFNTWIITPSSQTHSVTQTFGNTSFSYTDVFYRIDGISNHRMYILGGDNSVSGRSIRMDWIRVRKYVETEPTFTYGTPEIYRALTTIDVDLERSTLVEGETCTLNATAYDQFGEAMSDVVFTWASSNETVGTVSEDRVFTARNNGSTEICAMNNSIYGSETAHVTHIVSNTSYWNWSVDGWYGWSDTVDWDGVGSCAEYGPIMVDGHGEYGMDINLVEGAAEASVEHEFYDPAGIGWDSLKFVGRVSPSDAPSGRWMSIEVESAGYKTIYEETEINSSDLIEWQMEFNQNDTVSVRISHGGNSTSDERLFLEAYSLELQPTLFSAQSSGMYPSPAFNPESNSLILYEGWNLVSTPLWLAEGYDTMAFLYDAVDTADHSILWYNGSSSRWEPLSFQKEFRPLEGIWIYANGSYQIPLYFKPAQEQTGATKHLYPGWNLIGFGGVHQACARDMLLPLGSAWVRADGYDPVLETYEPTFFRDSTGGHSDQRLMFPGKGYWVHMDGEGDLSYIYPTYRAYSFCAEWVGDYHGMQPYLPSADEEAEGFYDTLDWSSSWTGQFINGNDAAMERHWKDPAFGGVDSNYIDNAHLAFFVGHGWESGFVFGTAADDYNLEYDEARWGNTKTDWIILASCSVLNESTREHWEDAFEGLHSICGFDTMGTGHPDMGWYFADLLMEGKTIWEAWYTATDRYVIPNDGSLRSAILAADIDGDLSTPDCLDDHIYGYGSSINPPGDPLNFQYKTDPCKLEV